MGLSDRDYMRERHRHRDREAPFKPPDTGIGLLWMIAFWVLAGFACYKLYAAYGPKLERAPRKVQVQATQAPPAAAPERVRETVTHTETVRTVIREVPAPALPAPAPAPAPRVQAQANSNTIYLCRAYNGGTFWAQAHCNQHKALIERIAYVPPDLPFDQQVAIASEQRRQGMVLTQNAVTTHGSGGDTGARPGECAALDARIQQLDTMARQPQSPQIQDWIAEQRRQARDRQFRLRC